MLRPGIYEQLIDRRLAQELDLLPENSEGHRRNRSGSGLFRRCLSMSQIIALWLKSAPIIFCAALIAMQRI